MKRVVRKINMYMSVYFSGKTNYDFRGIGLGSGSKRCCLIYMMSDSTITIILNVLPN